MKKIAPNDEYTDFWLVDCHSFSQFFWPPKIANQRWALAWKGKKSTKTKRRHMNSITIYYITEIVIVISKLLKRHPKAKHWAPAYSRALASNQRGCRTGSL